MTMTSPPDDKVSALLHRVSRLERSNRLARIVCGLGIVVISSVVALAQSSAPSRVVQTNRLEVIGKDGRPRVCIGDPDDPDTCGIVVFDRTGKVAAMLATGSRDSATLTLFGKDGATGYMVVDDDGPMLALGDGKDRQRVCLKYVKATDRSSLRLTDKGGKGGAYMTTESDGSSAITMDDGDGVHRLAVQYDSKHGPALRMTGTNGKDRAWLHVSPAGNAEMLLADRQGKLGTCVRTAPGGEGSVMVLDQDRIRAALGVTFIEATPTPPSSLVLFDKDGKPIFEAPAR
jgi:hypothetical protein